MIYIFQLDLDRVAWNPTTLEVDVVRSDSLYAAVLHYAELLYKLIKESEGGDLVRVDPGESENSLTITCTRKVYKLSIYLTESSLIENYATKADSVRIPSSIIELIRHELVV
jgi:hypothetical protein